MRKQIKKDIRKTGSFNLHIPTICKTSLSRHYSEHVQEECQPLNEPIWEEKSSTNEEKPNLKDNK